MFHQLRKVIYLVVVLSLLAAGTASANGLPTWVTAFDPGPYLMPDPETGEVSYFVHSVEEFKNDLYIVAGNPGWFTGVQGPGRVFRSPDGMSWEPVTVLGFGLGSVEDECGTNYYDTTWDMTVFQNMLYMLPFDGCYTRPGMILRSSDGVNWESVADTAELGSVWGLEWGAAYHGQFHKFGVFKGMLYVDMDNFYSETNQQDLKIFRSPTGDPGTWEEVADFPDWGSPGSFQTFKGGLYVASDGIYVYDADNDIWNQLSDQIWRSFDGLTWEKVADGFGNAGVTTLGGMLDYKGYLYAGAGYYTGTGSQIWRSQDGLQWEPVMMDGFGNPNNEKIDGFGIYLGKLYAYAVNWTDGGSVYRTQDAQTWEQASELGWGNPNYYCTHHISDQVVFKDEFYMGVLGPQGVLLKMPHPDK